MHTDANIAQFWARRAPSVDAHVFTHRTCGSRSRPVCHSMSSMHAHLCLVSWVVSPHPSLHFFLQFLFQLYLMSIPAPDEISMEDPLCDSSLGSMITLDYVTPLTVWKTQLFLLNGICMVILWQDYYGKNNLRKSHWNMAGRKFQIGNVSLCTSWKRIILVCVCGWHQIGCEKTKSWSDVENTLQRSRFGRTNIFHRSCILWLHSKTMWNKQKTVDNYKTMFESRISAGGVEKLPFPQNLRISSWSWDVTGHAKKCVKRYCELANKTTQQLYKVSTPCIDDHHFKEEETKSVRELSHVFKLFWSAETWHELGDRYFMVSKQARTISHTFIILVKTNNIVMWVILLNNADWDCFKTLTSREIQNPLPEEHCAFLEVTHLFQ